MFACKLEWAPCADRLGFPVNLGSSRATILAQGAMRLRARARVVNTVLSTIYESRHVGVETRVGP